ncbi:hypothetical protein B0H14DRAFT_2637594 [Mycena olivaceomarginata]|nr:hypothetical protein B0H14DRAFT_2637594 [Mycena olivaceomarginata]
MTELPRHMMHVDKHKFPWSKSTNILTTTTMSVANHRLNDNHNRGRGNGSNDEDAHKCLVVEYREESAKRSVREGKVVGEGNRATKESQGLNGGNNGMANHKQNWEDALVRVCECAEKEVITSHVLSSNVHGQHRGSALKKSAQLHTAPSLVHRLIVKISKLFLKSVSSYLL